MKKLLTILICSAGLSVAALAQGPGAIPPSSPMATAAAISPASPAATASPSESADSSTLAGRIHNKINKNLHSRGVHIDVGDDDSNTDTPHDTTHVRTHGGEEIPDNVIPIVAIAVLGFFGCPVLAFALLLYFGSYRTRMLHRTVRMMVEKGQPVPAALLNPPASVRKRSDMRRGVIWSTIGMGIMGFFAAVSDGDGGVWAIGLIPFLIGVGYLLVWKLEGKSADEAKADNLPPLP